MNTIPITWRSWLADHSFEDLFDIQQNEPHTFDGIAWSPGQADKLAAWEFYTELRTRITTQRLAYQAGDEVTALDSVYRLFELSRSIIKVNSGCTHFATLIIRALNIHVRPFTAKWHRERLDGRLSSADVRFQFRRELSNLQTDLRKLTHLMGILAGDNPQIAREEEEHAGPAASRSQELFAPLRFGIEDGMRGTDLKRERINAMEAAEIKARRNHYALAGGGRVDGPKTDDDAGRGEGVDAVGLSISGGGIRSATFALGILQQLGRKGILHQVDYLSTVSGGGYLGAFISSFLNDEEARVSLIPEKDNLPFGAEKDPESRGVRQLRNHGKYLIEGGVGTLVTIVAMIVYGVFTSAMLLAPFLLTNILIAAWFFHNSFKNPGPFLPLSLPTLITLALLAIGILLLPLLSRGRGLQSWWGWACILLGAVSLMFLAGESLPSLLNATYYIGGPPVLFFSIVTAPIVLGALGLWLGVASRLGRIVLGLFTIVGPMLILAAFLWLADIFIVAPSEPSLSLLGVLTFASWIYSSLILNINYASPHAYYRDRLARTYLIRATEEGKSIRQFDPQKLSEMNKSPKAPYHLINCAVNIPNSKDPDLRGRNTDFFVFSKHFCGGPMVGFYPTVDWERMDSHLDLGTAMAISGAAAAPHMGTLTSVRYTFLLALLNVRLGYWLRKPTPSSTGIKKFLPPVAWYYFFLELFGGMSEKTSYLNLSDGGHIENLGIYELLRRRCKFVIAVDGEADHVRSFGGLLTLTQLAKIDLGVTIEPDLTDLRTDSEGLGRSHFGLSRIDYPDGTHGLLLYIKSSLTGNESEFLKKYRAENPDFPHQSTAQQLFSETQFEAYRALGEHIAQDLFRSDLVDNWQSTLSVHEWFKRLAAQLLD